MSKIKEKLDNILSEVSLSREKEMIDKRNAKNRKILNNLALKYSFTLTMYDVVEEPFTIFVKFTKPIKNSNERIDFNVSKYFVEDNKESDAYINTIVRLNNYNKNKFEAFNKYCQITQEFLKELDKLKIKNFLLE